MFHYSDYYRIDCNEKYSCHNLKKSWYKIHTLNIIDTNITYNINNTNTVHKQTFKYI